MSGAESEVGKSDKSSDMAGHRGRVHSKVNKKQEESMEIISMCLHKLAPF